MQIYNNFNDFQKANPDLATELLNYVKPGDWQDSEIYLYDDPEDFAKYQIEDGIYATTFNHKTDFYGAPNLFDFLDYKALGNALINTADSSMGYLTSDNHYIETSYGWDLK